jgi:hypothetical protein
MYHQNRLFSHLTLSFTTLFLAFGLLTTKSVAQCDPVSLDALQVLQKTDPAAKEAKILAAGFDLRNATTANGITSKIYTKCWVTTIRQKTYFDQKIIWNITQDNVKFATLNEAHFQVLRKVLDERHPAGIGATVVVGKVFKYYFGVENMDGADYYTLTLSTR